MANCYAGKVEWDVALPQELVWDIMADTNRLGELIFNETSSKVIRRNAKSATLVRAYVGEYEEFPWVFEVPRTFKNCRIFSHKYLKKLEQELVLSSEAKDGKQTTHVEYKFNAEVSSGFMSSMLLKVLASRMKSGLSKVEALLKEKSAEGSLTLELPPLLRSNGDHARAGGSTAVWLSYPAEC